MDRRLYQSEVEETTLSVRYQLDHHTMKLCKVRMICLQFMCACPHLLIIQIFEAILRASPESKQMLITWLVLCFDSNGDRGKMAAVLNRVHASHKNQASDGFFVNLSWILLRLSSPFMVSEQADSVRTTRVKAIDVSYCAYNAQTMTTDAGAPLVDFRRDSKLVPQSEGT